MISIVNSSKWYGQVIGVNDVSCEIGGGITALLGQNGAGKSTLIKLITGQLKPTTGEVTVFGHHPFANPAVHARMGYCPETDSFYEEMTGRQFVQLMGRMAGIALVEIERKASEVLEEVGMSDRCDTRIAGYSKGMRQRIKLAQALIHNPDILVLDEPLNGLDPLGRRHISDILRNLAARGKAILISSHILHEVEQLTQNIVLLHRGRLLALGDIKEIRGLIDRHPHRIKIQSPAARKIGQELVGSPTVLSVTYDRLDSNSVVLETISPDKFYDEFADIVVKNNLTVEDYYSPDNNLEAVFGYLVQG